MTLHSTYRTPAGFSTLVIIRRNPVNYCFSTFGNYVGGKANWDTYHRITKRVNQCI